MAEDKAGMDAVAESYVRLVLAVGQHDPDYVDAYYGPETWRPAENDTPRPLSELRAEATAQIAAVEELAPAADPDEMALLRHAYLKRQLESLATRVALLEGEQLSFDQESRALYDAVVAPLDVAEFEAARESLERALAAEGHDSGSLSDRLAAFRDEFVIPPERLEAVFEVAIAACRERTLRYIDLPEGESFRVEYVTDKPWSGYNWYQGGFDSLIQVNTDLPVFIDRAIDLACHEGYPGHHVYNSLLEKHLVDERGFVELSIYPLFSPQSLIAEGTANFGIRMAFPGAERVRFETETLFPLAGLDPDRGEAYYRIHQLSEDLRYLDNEVARRYLDGQFDVEAATSFMVRFGSSPERAAQRIRFFDTYRTYVINYTLGQDMVSDYIDARAGDDADARWRVFGELLSSPRLPSGLR